MTVLILAGRAIVAVAYSVEIVGGAVECTAGRYPFAAGITETVTVAVLPDGFELGRFEYAGGEFIELPPPPPPQLTEAELASLKAKKNADINRWRLEANKTQFTHNGKVIACDELSRGDIDAVASSIALTGSFPAEFPGAWKAVDNSLVLLPTIEAFKAMYASMTAQGTANFNRSQQLKAALAAATTEADIDAIVW